MSTPEYWRDLRHPDFRNVIRVARFHQARRRIQFLTDQPANVIVLPLLRHPGGHRRKLLRSTAEASAAAG
jgi:hypothetical protein